MAPLPPLCDVGGRPGVPSRISRVPAGVAVIALTIGSGGDRVAYLADGLADAIAEQIGVAAPSIEVLGRRAQRRTSDGGTARVRGLGPESESRYLVSGTVSGGRGGTRVLVSLYDTKAGRRTWERTFAYDSVGGQGIVRTAVNEILTRLGGAARQSGSGSDAGQTRSVVAYDWYLHGEAAVDALANDRASDAFRQAVKADANFAAAHASLALADAALLDEGIEELAPGVVLLKELRTSATRALALAPSSSLAWLAEARARLLEGRPASAWRAAFDRALALDPKDPRILEQYGFALAQSDDRAAATAMLRRAAERSTRLADILTALAELSMTADADADACGLLNQAIANDALYGPAWAARALVRARHGDLRFAWADAETATQVGNPLLGQSAGAIVDLKARDTTHARSRLTELWMDVESRGTISVREGRAVAAAYIAAGQMPRALDVLERVRPRGTLYAATLHDPTFDAARREKRFRQLVGPSRGAPPQARAPSNGRSRAQAEGPSDSGSGLLRGGLDGNP